MTARARTPHRFALPALLIGATAIGLAPIFVRVSEVGPVATAFYRLFLSLPPLLLWCWLERRRQPARRQRRDPAGLRWMIVAGLCFAADLAFFHWSIQITSVANATLLSNLASVFVTVASVWLFGQRLAARLIIGLVVALSGAVLLMGQSVTLSWTRALGDAFGVAAAVFYAGYILAVARSRSGTSTATVMCVGVAAGAAALLPLALIMGDELWPDSAAGWWVLWGLALVSHVGGQGLITWSLAHLSATFGSISLLWQPVAAALFAWSLLGESLGPVQGLGGALVIAGIVMARNAGGARH
jgi:drug/metabolite transporter (DMT)-like permease